MQQNIFDVSKNMYEAKKCLGTKLVDFKNLIGNSGFWILPGSVDEDLSNPSLNLYFQISRKKENMIHEKQYSFISYKANIQLNINLD